MKDAPTENAMATGSRRQAAHGIGVLFGTGTLRSLSDGQLLARVKWAPTESAHAAFTALVERHAPMVFRVCRDILRDTDDAQDAFQATFLVLVREAAKVRRPDSVGSWLHGVATRISLRARADAARRRAHERRKGELTTERTRATDGGDVEPVLHEELRRLPEKYRAPIVLCYMEGLTHDEAAAHLGWPVGTVRGRLARARDLLRARLTRRGLVVAIALDSAAARAAHAAVPSAIRDATIESALAVVATGQSALGHAVSARVRAWILGELQSSPLAALKVSAYVVLAAGLLGAYGVVANRDAGDGRPVQQPAPPPSTRQVPSAQASDDTTAIQGTWTASPTVTRSQQGKPLPPETIRVTWDISGDRIVETTAATPNPDDSDEHIHRFKLNGSTSPRAIDLTSVAYGKMQGIYRLVGDKLTVCYGADGRPTAFAGGGESGPFLLEFKRSKRTADRPPARYPNAEGCEWALYPINVGNISSMMTSTRGGFVLSIEHGPDQSVRVTLAHPGRRAGTPAPEYSVVAFDAARRRYPLTALGFGEGGNPSGGSTVALRQFWLDPKVLPVEKVTRVGVEVITPESRAIRSQAAQANARAAGIEVLPPPAVGKPFDFALTTIDGRNMRSADLRGKVILIDCWATWCSPCMQKMPELKKLYSERHADGLEVIGVNFDLKPDAARQAIQSLGLSWPQVAVPGDDATRELWNDAAEIDGLPRIYLIDGRGVLRSAPSPDDLAKRVGELLDERNRP